jgi:hypothetical protein
MAGSVANARKANTSGATSTTTTSFTSTAGGTIWVGVSDASGQGSLTISDNKGNSYTQIGTTRTSASGAQIRRYYCANIAGGAGHTVTATWGSNSDATVHVLELAGVATASLDSAASAQADDNNPPWTVTSGTLAQADSIAVAMTGTAFNGTWSESSGFTVQTQEGDNNLYWTGCAASRVVAATTALTPSFTISGGGSDCAVAIDVFKASAGGTSYDLTVDPASYALTAAAETVTATRALTISPASYALTAAAVNLAVGRAVNFAPASYTLTAAAETLTVARALNIAPAAYALTAADVTLDYASANPVLSADPASYTLSLPDVSLEYGSATSQRTPGGSGGGRSQKAKAKKYNYDYSSPKTVVVEPAKAPVKAVKQKAKKSIPADMVEMLGLIEASESVTAQVLSEQTEMRAGEQRQFEEEQEMMAVIACCL